MKSIFLILLDEQFVADDERANFTELETWTIRYALHKDVLMKSGNLLEYMRGYFRDAGQTQRAVPKDK